jgi:hypothetical protein
VCVRARHQCKSKKVSAGSDDENASAKPWEIVTFALLFIVIEEWNGPIHLAVAISTWPLIPAPLLFRQSIGRFAGERRCSARSFSANRF